MTILNSYWHFEAFAFCDRCQNIWFSKFVLHACICALLLSDGCAHIQYHQTHLALRGVFVSASDSDVSASFAYACVFTRLQVCAIAFDSEHGMIYSRWLLSSRKLRQPKRVQTESNRQDRNGMKKTGMWLPSNHPLSRGSIHPHPSLCLVCDIDTECLPG